MKVLMYFEENKTLSKKFKTKKCFKKPQQPQKL